MDEYLEALLQRLRSRFAEELLAVWVVGSSALGDFDPARSDVDVQAVVGARPGPGELAALAADLSAVPCPVRGLEFVLYVREDLTDPRGPAFALNLNTGPGMTHHEGYDPDAEPRFWFTLDVSIAREHGVPLHGPHPREVLPELDRELVEGRLRDSLTWYRGYGGADAVFTACRAWAWSAEGRWLSKGEAALWAAARLTDATPVTAALATRTDPEAPGPSPEAVTALLDHVEATLQR